MSGITIVTGSPGAGKTTLAHHVSTRHPRGLHIPADLFYTFPAHWVPPVLPEAHEQNAAVIAAVSRTAAAFASRRYEVFLDGIIGPWFLPVVAAELGATGIPIEYVVLQVSLDQAIRRATSRTRPGSEAVVRQMHAQFQELGDYASHVFDTTDLGIDDVCRIRTAPCGRNLRAGLGASPGGQPPNIPMNPEPSLRSAAADYPERSALMARHASGLGRV